jgi:hypothetical protein
MNVHSMAAATAPFVLHASPSVRFCRMSGPQRAVLIRRVTPPVSADMGIPEINRRAGLLLNRAGEACPLCLPRPACPRLTRSSQPEGVGTHDACRRPTPAPVLNSLSGQRGLGPADCKEMRHIGRFAPSDTPNSGFSRNAGWGWPESRPPSCSRVSDLPVVPMGLDISKNALKVVPDALSPSQSPRNRPAAFSAVV